MTNNYTANQNAIIKVIKANITSITNGQPNAIHISKLFFPILRMQLIIILFLSNKRSCDHNYYHAHFGMT